MSYCKNCGSKVYSKGCVNCNEEAYILEQYYEQGISTQFLSKKFMKKAIKKQR